MEEKLKKYMEEMKRFQKQEFYLNLTEQEKTFFELIGLSAETGELVNIYKKCCYKDVNNLKERKMDEFSDILYHYIRLCIIEEISFDELISHALFKLKITNT